MELKDIVEKTPKYTAKISEEANEKVLYSEKAGKCINVDEEAAGEMQYKNIAMAPGSWY